MSNQEIMLLIGAGIIVYLSIKAYRLTKHKPKAPKA